MSERLHRGYRVERAHARRGYMVTRDLPDGRRVSVLLLCHEVERLLPPADYPPGQAGAMLFAIDEIGGVSRRPTDAVVLDTLIDLAEPMIERMIRQAVQ